MSVLKNDRRIPFLRIAKRAEISRRKAWAIRIAAILLSLITGGLLIIALGHNPFSVYMDMVTGSFSTRLL